MIRVRQLRDLVVRPVLGVLALPSIPAACQLLLVTAMQESGCGDAIAQEGGGPALGVWQMEPATHDDLWENFLPGQPGLEMVMEAMVFRELPRLGQLAGNLYYACAMARVLYWRAQGDLPEEGDKEGLGSYYLKHYNAGGKATLGEWNVSWEKVMAQLTGNEG